MKKITSTFACLCACGWFTFLSCSPPEVGERSVNLIPAPTSVKTGEQVFTLNQKSDISYSDPSLKEVAEDLAAYIRDLTGWTLSIPSSPSGRGKIHLELTPEISGLKDLLAIWGASPKDGNPADEQYSLSIQKKQIRLQATTPEGIYRGTTSLKQLAAGNRSAKGEPIYLPVLEVKDSPRFAWRGLSLDVSRCFFTPEEVKQVIDMLALYKMNVLHIHLTDNQGWRIEINKYPKLTEIGSQMPNEGKPAGYYTQQQFKELVQYAAGRFITIVPEIDIPGHAAALFASYPGLKDAVQLNVDLNLSGQALGALDADDPYTMQLVKDVITEVAALTPGSYIHIGGDETLGLSEDKFIRFVNQTRQFVLDNGKKMVGWQEVCRADITAGDLFQHWIYFKGNMEIAGDGESAGLSPEVMKLLMEMFSKAAEDVESGISRKARAIVSPSTYVYLDHRYLEPSTDPAQADEQERLGMPAYPKQTIEQMYDWNPSTFNPLLDPSQNIGGIEAAIWCETISSFRELQFMLMPRLAGVAEKGWSKVEDTSWEEYRTRLSSHPLLWETAHWNYFKSSLVDWK